MGRQVILDTDILIAVERNKLNLPSIVGHDDPAIASITAMELLVGVARRRPGWQDERALKVEGYFVTLLIEDYTLDVARVHALLHNHSTRTGRPRDAHDLIIAATAAVTGRTLLTADKAAAFHELPGVRAEVVEVG